MKRPAISILCALATLALCHPAAGKDNSILSLSGQWRLQLDRADAGINERWQTRTLPAAIRLPGSLPEQGIGDSATVETKWTGGIVDKSWFTSPDFEKYRQPGNVKVPFWLQPEHYYVGAAWYQRDVEIPGTWAGKRVTLFLERPHWETRVWVDDRLIGTNNALATPHEYDLGPLPPGRHTITIRVDNRMVVDVGENSHSVSDHTQGNWNGIVGNLYLRATARLWIEDLQVYPDRKTGTVRLRGRLGNATGVAGKGTLAVRIDEAVERGSFRGAPVQQVPVSWEAKGGAFDCEVRVPSPRFWDEFQPNLYNAEAWIEELQGPLDAVVRLFGFREITTQGTQFLINGRPTFFRGTLECCIFPRTGHPPTAVTEWRRILGVAKAHGLNMLRFHSWCPPEAAFVAADELGVYFQVECSSWANQSTTLGDGKPIDEWSYAEADRILKAYGNHPSFVLFLQGNEPGGARHQDYLKRWVQHYRDQDPRRLVSSGAGWPQLPENQFHVAPEPRVQAWGDGLKSRINAKPPETVTDYREYIQQRQVPVVSHEIGQWCVYPNFDEMRKYTGYLKARNFEIFRDRLEARGLGKLGRPFLLASGKLQALCYKEDIESALRTPGMGGYQLLDLHDFPGQGTALVGVLDPFWEEKGYITPKEFSRFSNATVPLARLKKRVFTTDESLEAEVEVAHYAAAPISEAVVEWWLARGGRTLARGVLPGKTLLVGQVTAVGQLKAGLQGVAVPAQCKLVVRIRGTAIENDWDIWIYPASVPEIEQRDILISSDFDEHAQTHLREGGKLLLTIPGGQVRNFETEGVKLGFSSIFWNTAWTARQAPTTLGVLCDPKHPALAQFPTDDHSNWQWWYLLHRAGALRLDLLPPETQPIVRIIDDWFTARPLGLVVEGKVGRGKVVICGVDLTSGAEDPVSKQMRATLVRYLQSKDCRPKASLTVDQITSLIQKPGFGKLNGVRALQADSEQNGYEVNNVADSDPNTMWHTGWGTGAPGLPHELIVEFDAPRPIMGLQLLPRQDGLPNGVIKGYEVYGSADGRNWGTPLARGEAEADAEAKTIRFGTPATVRFLKLKALSSHGRGEWTSLAELGILAPAAN
jgi:hypothetical protein